MSHMIELDEKGAGRTFGVKLEPWHHLGIVLNNPPTSAEAIKAAGMDWQVVSRDLYWSRDNNNLEEVPNRVALVRSSDEKLLAVVSKEYTPLQNSEAFEFFDSLVLHKLASYETAGVLCEGRKVWIQAKLTDDLMIQGEQHKPYVLLRNGHDGSTAVMVMPALQRVVCNNTLQLALREGGITHLKHCHGIKDKLEAARQVFSLTTEKMKHLVGLLDALAAMPMDATQFEQYLNDVLELEPTVIDETEMEHDAEHSERGEKFRVSMRDKIREIHEGGIGFTPGTGTYLGAYNSVVAFVDHFGGSRARDRGNWVLFGGGRKLKDKALDLALAQ